MGDEWKPSDETAQVSKGLDHKSFLDCSTGIGKTPPRKWDAEYLINTHGPSILEYELPARDATETETIIYNYLPEYYRRMVNGAISFVCYLHSKGISLEGDLDMDTQLCFIVGEIKFCGLNFIKSSGSSMKEDFRKLAFLIDQIITAANPSGLTLPDDMGDLFSYMTNFKECDKILLENHLALLPTKAKLDRIKDFFAEGIFLKGYRKLVYISVVSSMRRSEANKGDWTRRFEGSDADPALGPALSCFQYVPHPHPYLNDNMNILRFTRNVAEHLGQHLRPHKENFSEMDVELIIMALFSKELLSFQREAHKRNIFTLFVSGSAGD